MNLIQINASYKPAYIYGGPTMSVSKLAEELTKAGLALQVFTTTANGNTELVVPHNKSQIVADVKVSYFKRLTKDHTHFSPRLLWQLHKTILQSKKLVTSNLVVHIHAWWNLVSIFSCLVAYLHKVPVILSPRGMLTDYTLSNRNSVLKSIIHNLMGKKLLRYCHIHATSNKEKLDVLKITQPKSITVISNFVRVPAMVPVHSLATPVLKLIFLSRIEEKKGLDILFNALIKCNFNWELSIAGTGKENYLLSLKSLSEKLNLAKHVTWLGHIADDDKFKLLAQHDILVLPSFNENFANVVVESLAVGTAVLVTNKVGLADYVIANNFGWVCEAEVNAISQKLQQVYSQKDELITIKNNAPEKIKRDFSDENIINLYLKMYAKIL